MNNPGGLATPVSGVVYNWSLYNRILATVNATITTWTGPGATTLRSSAGSVTSASKTTGTSGVSAGISISPTASSKSNRWESSPSVGLLFLVKLLLFLVL
jgi:hypothetical protein